MALPLLEKAVEELDLGRGDEPIVIADYGSSQGENSLAPMRVAADRLRHRAGAHRAIVVFHVDQPSNDFNTLFTLLDADADTYTRNDPNIFSSAIGRSFYRQVLPPGSVHLAWSSYAAVWLSRIPTRIPGHFIPVRSNGSVHAAFENQAARDWEAFLTLRAAELRTGGRLLVVLPGLDDDGRAGLEDLMDYANAALAQMDQEGAIRAQERERMAIGAYPRRTSELLAPFEGDNRFAGLKVESCELLPVPDFAWPDYEQTANADALAARRALFFRSTFAPTLALGLDDAGDPKRSRVFADRLEHLLKHLLLNYTEPLRSYVHVFAASKQPAIRS